MRKISRKTLSLAVLAVSCSNLYAQTQPASVERPSLAKGDSWTYRTIDNWSDKELFQSEVVFAEMENDLLVFLATNKTTNTVHTIKSNSDLQPCRTMRNDSKLICQGELKFPITVGDKHKMSKLPWSGGSAANEGAGYNEADCEVKAAEKVTVPAGIFDTFRIECSGYQTRVFDGSYTGSYKSTNWYAPLVKRTIKSYFENRGNRGIDTKQTSELTSYKVR